MIMTNTPLPENSHFISKDRAITMTSDYRTHKEGILAPAYQGQDILPLSETFNRQALDQLLATEGCAGLRIYYGMDGNLKIHAVMVAVNALNQDILPASGNLSLTSDPGDGVIVEEGQRCPPVCPDKSPLNG
jgi:hypothetical protein